MGGKESKLSKKLLTVICLIEFIKNLKKEWIISNKSEIEILNSLRLGTDDYDFNSIKLIKRGGQGAVFEIKSKIDDKIYAGKRL